MFDPQSKFRRYVLFAAAVVGVYFLLTGWIRLVQPSGPTDKSGRWMQASEKEKTDSKGRVRNDVQYIILRPNQRAGYNFDHVSSLQKKCGDGIVNVLLWEAEQPNRIRREAYWAQSRNFQYQPADIPTGERSCTNMQYWFTSPVRQVIRVSAEKFETRRGQRPPSNSLQTNLCRDNGCLKPMKTISGIEGTMAGETFKTFRSLLLGIALLLFAAATYFGYFRVYAIFFPSQSAKRASERLKRGQDINIDELAEAPSTDFQRRKHNEDLEALLDEATERLNELEKKEQELAGAKSEDDELLDELEQAVADVEEIQRKIREQTE